MSNFLGRFIAQGVEQGEASTSLRMLEFKFGIRALDPRSWIAALRSRRQVRHSEPPPSF